MLINVTIGEPMCRDIGAREKELAFHGDTSNATVALGKLMDRLGITFSDSEGSLLVIVNGELIPPEKANEFRLHHRDHVDLHVILAGG